MATAKQIKANRANAQHSTGPRTAKGKANSSRNATTHGLTAAGFIVQDAQQEELLQLKSGLREALHPEGAVQEALFDEIVRSKWKIRRCHMADTQLFLDNPDIDPLLDDKNGPKLTRIQSYAKREESSLYRAIKKLGEIQTEVQFRKQMFPWDKVTPLQETIHGVSELCNSRQVLNTVARLKKNKANPVEAPAPGTSTQPAQNEPISPRSERMRAELDLMRECLKAMTEPLPFKSLAEDLELAQSLRAASQSSTAHRRP